MTFLNLQPVLSKDEQERIASIEFQPFNEVYQDKLESEIFDGVKAKRKQDSLPKLSFNIDKVNSYKDLAVNKYTLDSPLSSSIAPLDVTGPGTSSIPESNKMSAPSFVGTTLTLDEKIKQEKQQANSDEKLSILNAKIEDSETYQSAIDKAGDFAGFVGGALDKASQATFGKAIQGVALVEGAVYFNAVEAFKPIKSLVSETIESGKEFIETGVIDSPFDEIEKPDFMAAATKWEDLKETTEYFFGNKMEWNDYLNIRSSEEKRIEIFSGMDADKQKQVKATGLDNWALGYDVIAGITSGVGIIKAPLQIATKVGIKTNLGKTMIALDKAMKVGEKGLVGLGATYGAGALMYYLQTGRWLFEGDSAATEGSLMMIGGSALKGLFELGKGGYKVTKAGKKYMDDMLANPEFQKGMENFMESAKIEFADKLDVLATKVGARTNLLPIDSKIINEIDEVRKTTPLPDDAITKSINETTSLLDEGLESSINQGRGIRNKLLDDGLINEGDSTLTGIRRAFKSKIAGGFIKFQDEIFGELAGDKGINKFLNPAQRKVAVALEQTRATGKIGLVQNNIQRITKAVGKDNLKEFNNYLFAKSRYFKVKNTDTKTFILGKNGKTKEISIEGLKNKYESLEKKFGGIAKELYDEYDDLLQREFDAGIRTADDLENFAKTNPFYIGDKVLDVQELLKTGPEGLNINIPKKNLAINAEEALSVDVVNNSFNEIVYRNEVLNRVEKLNKATRLGEGAGLITKVGDGATPKRGNIIFKTYEDGKLVDYEGPKFWVKDIFEDDRISRLGPIMGALTSIPKFFTRTFKETTTGRLAPQYQLVAPLFETPAAIARMLHEAGLKKGQKRIEFFKTLFRTPGALDATPASANAMSDLADFMGATFTQTKQLKKELSDTLGDEFKRYSAMKSKFQRGKEAGTKVIDFIDIGNIIERKTTRLPLFTQRLAASGLTKEALDKAVVEAKGSPSKLKKLLEKQGVDVDSAAGVATNFFDYLGVTKLSQEIGQYLPYFNSAMTQAKSSKRLLESNPKLFMGLLGASFFLDDAVYNFNTNTEEKKARYDEMPEYRTNTLIIYMGPNEKGEDVFIKPLRGVQPLEWTYGMYMQNKKRAAGEGFDLSEAFGKIMEDSTGISPIDEIGDVGQFLPTGVKQAVEQATGYNFFLKRTINKTARAKIFASEDYDNKTSKLALGTARFLTMLSGGEAGDDGVIRGGKQVSPKSIDKLFDSFDSGQLRGRLGNLFNNAQDGTLDKSMVERAIGVFIKTSNQLKSTQDIYDVKSQADAEGDIRSSRISTLIKEADAENLGDVARELAKAYPEQAKSIINKVKDRKLADNVRDKLGSNKDPFYAENVISISKMNNEEIAYNYIAIETDEGKDKAKKLIIDLNKAGLISDERGGNIIAKILQLKKNQ